MWKEEKASCSQSKIQCSATIQPGTHPPSYSFMLSCQYARSQFRNPEFMAIICAIKFSHCFATDVLAVLSQPEWPVAALVLERFLVHLNSEAGLKSSIGAIRQVSVDLLGTVAAALVRDARSADADAAWVMEASHGKGIHCTFPRSPALRASSDGWTAHPRRSAPSITSP